MSVGTRPLTAEELFNMPDDGRKYELVRGELTTISPAGPRHSVVALQIGAHLLAFVKRTGIGTAFGADCGFILERNPDTVRAPDAAFATRPGPLEETGFYRGAPDLAVEVISPVDRRSEVEAKAREYLAAASRMVIIVDPRKQTATVHTPTAITQLTIDDTIDGGDVVPGWKLLLREIFA